MKNEINEKRKKRIKKEEEERKEERYPMCGMADCFSLNNFWMVLR